MSYITIFWCVSAFTFYCALAAPAEFNQELVTRLKGLVSEQGQKVQDRSEPVAKIEPQSSQLMTESRGPAVRKRPDQRLFRPRGQIEADTKRAQLREKQQLQELEEEKLAKEKAVKEAEAAAAAQKRQEALRRSAQTQAQTPPPRLVSKTESRPWSSSRVCACLRAVMSRRRNFNHTASWA